MVFLNEIAIILKAIKYLHSPCNMKYAMYMAAIYAVVLFQPYNKYSHK